MDDSFRHPFQCNITRIFERQPFFFVLLPRTADGFIVFCAQLLEAFLVTLCCLICVCGSRSRASYSPLFFDFRPRQELGVSS
jgi:hypothetical protein